jgi:hypothetical protein
MAPFFDSFINVAVNMQRALGLSHTHATELLSEIAEKVKSGPYRGEWVLKAIYRVADGVNALEPSGRSEAQGGMRS